jgi:hypothetical protein
MRRTVFRAVWLLYLTVSLSLIVIPTASAYIDPASGSLVFQAIVAGLVAIPVALAAFWGRITAFFRRKR